MRRHAVDLIQLHDRREASFRQADLRRCWTLRLCRSPGLAEFDDLRGDAGAYRLIAGQRGEETRNAAGLAVFRSIFPVSSSTVIVARSPPGNRHRNGNLTACWGVAVSATGDRQIDGALGRHLGCGYGGVVRRCLGAVSRADDDCHSKQRNQPQSPDHCDQRKADWSGPGARQGKGTPAGSSAGKPVRSSHWPLATSVSLAGPAGGLTLRPRPIFTQEWQTKRQNSLC